MALEERQSIKATIRAIIDFVDIWGTYLSKFNKVGLSY